MKNIVLGLILGLSINCAASIQFPDGYTKVPEAKQEAYRKALSAALKENPTVAIDCDPQWMNDVFTIADDILLNKNSNQPLLIFNRYMTTGQDERLHRILFTTSSDLKHISQVSAEIYIKGEVNQGDLAHPVIVEDYVLQGQWNCTPAH